MKTVLVTGAGFLALLSVAMGQRPSSAVVRAPAVTVVRVPHGGIQPQVATDQTGRMHLVYFSGDAFHGDLAYVFSDDAGRTFSPAMRVNSQSGSAVAAGNIRGARIAVTGDGEVHVVWNGSSTAEPKTSDGRAPMLYSRLDRVHQKFEPQRNLIHSAAGIDGGGAVAADRLGNVFVFWHAPLAGAKDEAGRRVWVAQSTDGGATFAAERVAFDKPTGVCGCCGMSAFVDRQGVLYALFRSATEMVHRDMYLLKSEDHGRSFQGADVSPWNVGYCVMSSEAFAESKAGVFAAWETEKQVLYAAIDPKSRQMGAPMKAPGTGVNRKYPALAVNRDGRALLAWTEGMGWKKGGSAAWQVLDGSGKASGESGRADGVPAWGLVAAVAAPDGSFRVLY